MASFRKFVISSISPNRAAPPAIMASSMASSRPLQGSDYKCLISQIGLVPHFSLCAVPTRRGPPDWLRSARFNRPSRPLAEAGLRGAHLPCSPADLRRGNERRGLPVSTEASIPRLLTRRRRASPDCGGQEPVTRPDAPTTDFPLPPSWYFGFDAHRESVSRSLAI